MDIMKEHGVRNEMLRLECCFAFLFFNSFSSDKRKILSGSIFRDVLYHHSHKHQASLFLSSCSGPDTDALNDISPSLEQFVAIRSACQRGHRHAAASEGRESGLSLFVRFNRT